MSGSQRLRPSYQDLPLGPTNMTKSPQNFIVFPFLRFERFLQQQGFTVNGHMVNMTFKDVEDSDDFWSLQGCFSCEEHCSGP
jgi:hypothetical protein